MNFKVGQKVVCVKDHSMGIVKKGQIFTVLDTENCCVQCIDVGVDIDSKYIGTRCRFCGHLSFKNMLFSRLFRPLQTDTCHDEILEKFKSPEEQPDIVQIPHEEEV